jgi:hypothetical protein
LQLLAQELRGGPLRGSDVIEILNCPPYGLSMAALQDVTQRTELKFKVDTLLPGFRPPTESGNTQLKSYDLNGRLAWTKNFQDVRFGPDSMNSSTGSVWLNDAKHLQPIQAKVQVRNSNSGQTETVRADARVLFRPDLAIANVTAPRQVFSRQPFNVSAEIRELNGDLGQNAFVYLLDGNTFLDVAQVSISPGKNAGVVFAARLLAEGVHNLRIVLSSITPDYDPANNEAAFAIEVLRPALESVPAFLSYNYSDFNSLRQEENEFAIRRYFNQFISESFTETLYLPTPVSFPVSLASFRASVDGVDKGLVEGAVPYTFTDVFGCLQVDFGFAFLPDNTQITIQTVTDVCAGFSQSYAGAGRFSYEQLFFSSQYLKQTGEIFEQNSQSNSGNMRWLPTQNITSRFVVQDEAGSFGGNATLDTFDTSGFFNPFDFIDVDGTHVSGYDSQRIRFGNRFITTEP